MVNQGWELAILSQSNDVHEESRRIVLEHHERIDGSGYPNGLKGLEISPYSEIVGIVDMYDGMISSRRGRPPLSPARAIKEIYQSTLGGTGQSLFWRLSGWQFG